MADLALMTELARIAQASIRSFIPIRRFGRLRKGIRFVVTRERVTIFSIYYWTRFVNDGRPAIEANPKRPLIFFKDPKKDPRIKGSYPRRPKHNVRLTRRQYAYHKKRGNLIITKSVGSAAGLKFLEKGLQDARKKIPTLVRKRIQTDVRRNLRRRRDSITVGL